MLNFSFPQRDFLNEFDVHDFYHNNTELLDLICARVVEGCNITREQLGIIYIIMFKNNPEIHWLDDKPTDYKKLILLSLDEYCHEFKTLIYDAYTSGQMLYRSTDGFSDDEKYLLDIYQNIVFRRYNSIGKDVYEEMHQLAYQAIDQGLYNDGFRSIEEDYFER